MFIQNSNYDTKEVKSAMRRLEKAIKDLNRLGLIPFCGKSDCGVNIHEMDKPISSDNIVGWLDDVQAEGGDY